MRLLLSTTALLASLLVANAAAPVATNIANFPSVSVAYTNYIAEGIVTNGLTLGGVRRTTWPSSGSAPTNTVVWTGSAPSVGSAPFAADITGSNLLWSANVTLTDWGDGSFTYNLYGDGRSNFQVYNVSSTNTPTYTSGIALTTYTEWRSTNHWQNWWQADLPFYLEGSGTVGLLCGVEPYFQNDGLGTVTRNFGVRVGAQSYSGGIIGDFEGYTFYGTTSEPANGQHSSGIWTNYIMFHAVAPIGPFKGTVSGLLIDDLASVVATNVYPILYGAGKFAVSTSGLVSATNGFASTATDAAVSIATGGYTNALGKNAFVSADGTGMTYTVYNGAGTAVYTNAATVTHFDAVLQPNGKVLITAGSGISGRAWPW